MRVSATCTIPTPSVKSATPSPAAASASRGGTRSERLATTATSARIAEAARKRVPAVRSGGRVRTATLIPRYVEPHTRYTIQSAVQSFARGALMQSESRSGGVP